MQIRFVKLMMLLIFYNQLVLVASDTVCDEEYACIYEAVGVKGDVFQFNFASLCTQQGYNIVLGNSTFYFNVCGQSTHRCYPKFRSVVDYGVAVQEWGDTPLCTNSTSTQCKNLDTGKYECCTKPCNVLGTGIPTFYLVNASNPESGGVIFSYQPVPVSATDPSVCPRVVRTGTYQPRYIHYQVMCNRTQIDSLRVLSVNETTPCDFTVVLSSPLACSCASQCVNRTCGSDGCGGFCGSSINNGTCPEFQTCFDGVCCNSDCTNRTCGINSCGQSCGSCNFGNDCDSNLQCQINTLGIIFSAPIVSSFSGGFATPLVIGAIIWFLRKRSYKSPLCGSCCGNKEPSLIRLTQDVDTDGSSAATGKKLKKRDFSSISAKSDALDDDDSTPMGTAEVEISLK